jgi:hypothetical protein
MSRRCSHYTTTTPKTQRPPFRAFRPFRALRAPNAPSAPFVLQTPLPRPPCSKRPLLSHCLTVSLSHCPATHDTPLPPPPTTHATVRQYNTKKPSPPWGHVVSALAEGWVRGKSPPAAGATPPAPFPNARLAGCCGHVEGRSSRANNADPRAALALTFLVNRRTISRRDLAPRAGCPGIQRRICPTGPGCTCLAG